MDFGKTLKMPSRRWRSALKFGGSWNSTGPSLRPSFLARDQNSFTGSFGSASRLMCVMYRLAFTVTRNPSADSLRHRPEEVSSGSLEKELFTSTVRKRDAQ